MTGENGSLWTPTRLSEELGMDRRALGRRLRGVRPVRTERGGRIRYYRLADVVAALLQLERGDPRQLSAARTRLTNAQAVKAELEARVREGELVEVRAIRQEIFRMARQVRDRMLAIPSRVVAQLAAETDAHAIERILDREIRQALEALRAAAEERKGDE